MNLTELARRLRVPTEELKEKLPALGFDIGRKAIKVNPKEADRIMRAWAEMRRREEVEKRYKEQQEAAERARLRKEGKLPTKGLTLPNIVTVKDFAARMELPLTDVLKTLMKNGILASMNERLDFDTAAILAEDLGFKVEREDVTKDDTNAALDRVRDVLAAEDPGKVARPPVVVIMGHVDHGKTSLLDAIRKAHVAAGEAGGITQHIGAYQVQKKNRDITFIDTPGHEAFTVMRSRGAKVADIAVLVVAADDGVQPQTKEAISIIQAAKLPFIVAINKIDKPDANVEKTKTHLAEAGVQPEDWGGKVPFVALSAKTGQNLEVLLDMILLVSDVEAERIKANPTKLALGTVIESHVDKGEGPVATLLVQSGTLRTGDVLGVRGMNYGRVRAMRDWKGTAVREAVPGMPVKILGFKVAPAVGDIAEVPEDVKALQGARDVQAKKVFDTFGSQASAATAAPAEEGSEAKKFLLLVVKTDVLGSLEAILGKLETVRDEDVGIKVVSKGLGNITDGDIEAAANVGAVVYGFGVQATSSAEIAARDKQVPVICRKIIYEIFDDIQARLNTIAEPKVEVTELGKGEVLALFKKEDKTQVIGMVVKAGKVTDACKARIFRDNHIIGDGTISRVQVGKEQVRDARAGTQCGISITSKTKLEVGDILEIFAEEKKIRKIAVK